MNYYKKITGTKKFQAGSFFGDDTPQTVTKRYGDTSSPAFWARMGVTDPSAVKRLISQGRRPISEAEARQIVSGLPSSYNGRGTDINGVPAIFGQERDNIRRPVTVPAQVAPRPNYYRTMPYVRPEVDPTYTVHAPGTTPPLPQQRVIPTTGYPGQDPNTMWGSQADFGKGPYPNIVSGPQRSSPINGDPNTYPSNGGGGAGNERTETIKRIQRNLGVKDDGIWGDITEKAYQKVQAEQKRLGVKVDGVRGKETLGAQVADSRQLVADASRSGMQQQQPGITMTPVAGYVPEPSRRDIRIAAREDRRDLRRLNRAGNYVGESETGVASFKKGGIFYNSIEK